jgi:putative redox protein
MTATSAQAMTTAVHVAHRGGDRFDIDIRGHQIAVDQPVESGGDDTAPTPTELLVASLASCVAFYARRYLTRHGLDTEGLTVHAAYGLESRPARVASMDIELQLPPGVPESRRGPLLAVANHCTVHNTLADPPAVSIRLVGREPAPTAGTVG